MDTDLGKTFRKLRLSKNLSIKEIVSENFSYSQISKFENGKTSITLEKLKDGLIAINTSWEEFESAYSTLENDESTNFYEKLINYSRSHNIAALEHMLAISNKAYEDKPYKQHYKLDEILIKVKLHELDKHYKIPLKDRHFLVNYLLNIKEFGSRELFIYSDCINLFSDKEIISLINKIIYPEQELLQLWNIKQKKIMAVLNTISLFLDRNCFAPIQELFNYLTKNLDEDLLMYEKTTFIYLKALYHLKNNSTNLKAKEEMENCIKIFEFCGCYDTVNLAKNELKEFLSSHI